MNNCRRRRRRFTPLHKSQKQNPETVYIHLIQTHRRSPKPPYTSQLQASTPCAAPSDGWYLRDPSRVIDEAERNTHIVKPNSVAKLPGLMLGQSVTVLQ